VEPFWSAPVVLETYHFKVTCAGSIIPNELAIVVRARYTRQRRCSSTGRS
jgi:hypothetical protein